MQYDPIVHYDWPYKETKIGMTSFEAEAIQDDLTQRFLDHEHFALHYVQAFGMDASAMGLAEDVASVFVTGLMPWTTVSPDDRGLIVRYYVRSTVPAEAHATMLAALMEGADFPSGLYVTGNVVIEGLAIPIAQDVAAIAQSTGEEIKKTAATARSPLTWVVLGLIAVAVITR